MKLSIVLTVTATAILASCGSSDSSSSNNSNTAGGAGTTDVPRPTVALREGATGDSQTENIVVRDSTEADANTIRFFTERGTEIDGLAAGTVGYTWSNAYSNSSAYYTGRSDVDASEQDQGNINTDGIAIGGYYTNNGQEGGFNGGFSAFDGETSGAPTSGETIFDGVYMVGTADGLTQIDADIAINADSGVISTAATDGLAMEAQLNGNNFGGTITYQGIDGDVEGGFFGADELFGAFSGETFGGTVYGSAQ